LVAASHFFVGLGAGVALLTVPVLLFAPGLDTPGRMAAWVTGPPSASRVEAPAAANRPVRGYVPGEPTPGPAAPPPTLAAPVKPTVAPPQPQAAPTLPPATALRTGVIRSGGAPVPVRKAAGIESPNDPQLADGSPVLVSYGAELQIGGEGWRAVRGLNGIVGWVPSAMVSIDN